MDKTKTYLFRERLCRIDRELAPPYPADYVLIQFLNGGAVAVAATKELKEADNA